MAGNATERAGMPPSAASTPVSGGPGSPGGVLAPENGAQRVAWNAFIDSWLTVRAELAAIERAEHPDITDRFGRVWQWWKGDLYRHDGCLAIPGRWIPEWGLPSARLAGNTNYAGLCGICRQDWSVAS
jgi:hypothetical protein